MKYSIEEISFAHQCFHCGIPGSVMIYLSPSKDRPINPDLLSEGVTANDVAMAVAVPPTDENYQKILDRFSIIIKPPSEL